MSKDVQFRGHCQCCGREQAVLESGKVAKHGYVVKNGWFQGVCPGNAHRPMEIDRSVTDGLVVQIREAAANAQARVEGLKTGAIQPETIRVNRFDPEAGRMVERLLPFKDAPSFEREEAVKDAIREADDRARSGESVAASLTRLADQVHGKLLRQVKLAPPSPAILVGEKRRAVTGVVLEAQRISGGTVSFDDGAQQGWMSTRAWRQLAVIS